jgi:ectoine hydroxylase-related dioxygenase (phytanoyl-CoA dioxygenase family)
MTPDSGSTQIVPGSHRDQPRDAITITADPGDVIVLHPQTLHGGTTNHSGAMRRAITVAWSAP